MEQNMSALLMVLVAYSGVFVVLGILVLCINGLRFVNFSENKGKEAK